MKICIITLYNSLNYGAYLQALILSNVLKQSENRVSFLNTKVRQPLRAMARSLIKNMISFRCKEVCFELVKYFNFQKVIKKLTICDYREHMLKEQDIFVFGSDEIWNISRKEINKYPVLFGIGIPDSYFVSYAPSINKTNLEQIRKNDSFINAIQRFNKLSVRDAHSLDTLKVITSKDIELVLDPTFLFSKDMYHSLEKECYEKDYILIYGYENRFNQKSINQIKEFAQVRKLRLISVGNYFDWCDKNIPANPFEFLSYVKNALYVITNTFHGTIFSIIYNKKFVTYCGKELKINDVLKQFKLESRNVDNSSTLKQVIEDEIDYESVNNLIKIYKDNSYKYIYQFIEDWKKLNNVNVNY